MLTTRTHRIALTLGAFALAAVLVAPAAMANDSFADVMHEAAARNDTQILPDQYVGGASFISRSNRANPTGTTDTLRKVMRDARARNETQILPEQYVGGATFTQSTGRLYAGTDAAFQATMRDAAARNDNQLLPDQYSGGPSFLR